MGCVNAKPKIKRAGAAKVVKDAHDEGGPVGPFVPDGDLAAMYTENIAQLRRQVVEQGLTVVTEEDDDEDNDDARSDASTEILPINNNNNSASYADQQPGSATDRTRSKTRADRGNNNNSGTVNGLAPKQSVTPLRSMSGLSSSSPVGAPLGMTTTTQAESGCSATVCICRPLFEEPSMGTGMFGEAYLADMTVTTGLVLPSAQKLNEERVLAALLTAAASHTAPEAVAEGDITGERGNTPAGAAAAGSSLESKSVNSWTMSADGANNTSNNNIGSGSDTVGDGKPRRRKNKLAKQQQEQEARKGNKPNGSKTATRKDPNALGNDDNDGGSEVITRQSTINNNNNTDSLLTRTPQCSSLVQASAEWRQWRYLIAMTEFTVPGMDFDVLSTTKATLLSSMEQQQLSWLGAVREVVRQWCQLSVNCPHVLRCVQMEIFAKNEEVPTSHTTNKSTSGAALQDTSTRGSGPPKDTDAAQTTTALSEGVQAVCAGDAKDTLQPVVSVMDRHSSQLLRGSVRVTMRSELHFTESEVRTAMGMSEGTSTTHQQHSKGNTRPTTTSAANSSGQHHSTLPAHDYAACRTTKLRVYFELAKYGTLHTFRKEMQARYRRSYLHELTARALMREVLLGLYQVHEQGMLQYDLHAAEIYLVRPMQTVYKTLFPAYIADLPAGSIMKVPPNRMRHVLCQLDPTAPAAPRSASRDLRRRPLLAAPMPNTETTAAAVIGSNMNTNTGGGGGTSTALAAVTSGPHGSDVRRSRSVIAVASPETILGERSLEDITDLQDHLMQHHNHRPFGSPVRSNAAWPSPDGTHGTYDMISGTAEVNGANASSTSGCDMGNGSASPAGTAMRLDVFVGTEEDDDAFRLNPRAWRYFTEHGYLEDSLQLPSPINMYGLHEVAANSEDEERRSTNWFASSPERSKNNNNSRRRSMPLMLTAATTAATATTTPSALVGSAVTEVSLSAALQADKPAHNDNSGEMQVGRYGGVAQVILQRSQPANVITNTSNGVVDRARMAAGGSSNMYAESSMSTYGNTMTTTAGYGDGGNQASLQVSTSAFPLLLPPSRSATGLPTASGATAAVNMTRATCHRHTINPLPLLLAPRAKLDDFIVVPSVAEQAGGGLSERRALSASPLPSANRFASKDTRPSLRTRRPVVKLSGMIHVHRLLAQLSAHGPTHHGRNTSATNNNNNSTSSTAAAGNKGNNNSSGQAQSPFMVSVMRAEEVPVHRYIRVSHAAPEVLQRRRFSEASDVYAFAMTFLELVSPDGEVLPECRPTNMPFGRPTTRREWQEYDAQHALNLQRWYSTAIEQAIAQRSARAGLTGRSTGSGPDNHPTNNNNEGRTTGRHGSDAMSRTQDDLVVVPIPSHLSDECKRMLRACLQVNPSHRPTVAELLGCKYFLLGHWIDAQGAGGGGEEDCMSMGAILPEAPWGGEVDFVAAARAMGLPAMDHTNRAHSVTMPTAALLHHSPLAPSMLQDSLMCDAASYTPPYNNNHPSQQDHVAAVVRRYEEEWARWQAWQLNGQRDTAALRNATRELKRDIADHSSATAPPQRTTREALWRVVPRLVHSVLPASWLRRWRRQTPQEDRRAASQRARKSCNSNSHGKLRSAMTAQQCVYNPCYVADLYSAADDMSMCYSAWERPLPQSFYTAVHAAPEECRDSHPFVKDSSSNSSSSSSCTPSLHRRTTTSSLSMTQETVSQRPACTTAEALERLACSLRRVAELQSHTACGDNNNAETNVESGDVGTNTQDAAAREEANTDEAMHEAQLQTHCDSRGSLVHAAVHTAHDRAVRRAYDDVVGDYCTRLVRAAVQRALGRARGATTRALSELLLHTTLDAIRARNTTNTTTETENRRLRFTGILRHIKSGQPVALDALELDEEDHAVLRTVEQGRVSRGEQTAITFATAGYAISFAQLATLRAQCWLNDQVINNYLQLLCETMRQAGGTAETVASLGTHFYAKVQSEVTLLQPRREQDRSDSAHYASLPSGSALLRWLRRRRHLLMPYDAHDTTSDRTTTVRVVLIPVNLHDQHWALVVWDKESEMLTYYDSFLGVHTVHGTLRARCILAELKHVLCECARHLLTGHETQQGQKEVPHKALCHMRCAVAAPYTPRRTSWADWTPYTNIEALRVASEAQQQRLRRRNIALHTSSDSDSDTTAAALTELDEAENEGHVEWFSAGDAKIPQQKNGNDCGVFVCQAAWCAAQGVAVSFSQADIAMLRRVILLELWAKKLLRRLPGVHSSSSIDVCMW